MENLNKIVYLPLEFKNREFYSKTILAAKLIQKNFKVIIGQQWYIIKQILENNFPPGIFFQNSLNNIKYNLLKSFKELQFYNVLLDEESYGINFKYIDHYYKSLRSNYFNPIDKYYCNSIEELNFHKKLIKNKEKLLLTYNCRDEFIQEYSEILNPQVKEIKAKYNKFILINTNFALLHSMFGSFEEHNKHFIKLKVITQEDIKDLEKTYAMEKQNMDEIINFLKIALKKFHYMNFVLRNHPGESKDKLKESVKDLLKYKNFFLDSSLHTNAFIKASSLLIHFSCTTGMEAHYLNKPAINFIPSYLKNMIENNLSFNLNKKIFSVNDLISEIELIINDKNYYKINSKKNSISPSDVIVKDMESTCEKWNENFSLKTNNPLKSDILKEKKIGTIKKEEIQSIIDFVIKEKSLQKKNYKIYELFDSAFLLY